MSWPPRTAGCRRSSATARRAASSRPGTPALSPRVLAELAADPPQRERLGAAAAADVADRFSVARLLERTQALYDETLAWVRPL